MERNPSKTETLEVKQFFHGYAADFDSIYGHSKARGGFDKLMDKMFRQSMLLRFEESLKASANPAVQSILDVGCGSGVYCVEFLKQGKTVLGLDMAEGMLQIARQKTASFQNSGKIDFVLSDYMEFDAKQTWDAACLMGVFDYIKEPVPLIKKLQKDITKELYMSFPKKMGFLTWQRKVRYNLRHCPLYFYSNRSLIEILDQSGLKGRYTIKDLGRDFFVKVVL